MSGRCSCATQVTRASAQLRYGRLISRLTLSSFLGWGGRMDSVEVLWGKNESVFEGTPGMAPPTVTYQPGRSVDVTFTLAPPSQVPLIDGEIHLRWSGQSSLPGTLGSGTTATSAMEEPDEAGALRTALDRLTPSQRSQIAKVAVSLPSNIPALHILPAGTAAGRVTAVPTPPASAVRMGTRAGVAAQKAARDTEKIRRICKASGGPVAGLPGRVCATTVQAPSH
jgi:hypothetical protein